MSRAHPQDGDAPRSLQRCLQACPAPQTVLIPMRVLIISFGSTGDIYPLVRFGNALVEAGHDVRFATSPLFREPIESAGVPYVHLPPDWDRSIYVEFMRELNRAPVPILQLRHIYEGALPFMSELLDKAEAEIQRGTDVVVSSYFFPHFRFLAERNGAAFATFAFCHNVVPNDEWPPEMFPRLRGWPPPLKRRWNRIAWRIGDWLVSWTLRSVMADIFRRHNLTGPLSFLAAPADLAMVGVSPRLTRWSEVHPRFRMVGFLRWQSARNADIDAVLNTFCDGQSVPVITFGSVAFDNVHRIMSRFLKHWPQGKKVIIQTGWAGLSVEVERPEICVVGEVSHDQLFRFASMVIHHGGAGTTASVIQAGKPHIVIPHIADQNWWAAEVCRQRVGRRLHKLRWPERLPRAVRRIERNPLYRLNAERLAEAMRAEDGPRTAVTELERFVAERKPCTTGEEGFSVVETA